MRRAEKATNDFTVAHLGSLGCEVLHMVYVRRLLLPCVRVQL